MRYITLRSDSTGYGCLAAYPSWFSYLHQRLDFVSEPAFYSPWNGPVSGGLGARSMYYNKIIGGGWTFFNASIGGYSTEQLYDQTAFATDVLGHHTAGMDHTVILAPSLNSFNNGITGGVTISSVTSLVEARALECVAAGITVVLGKVNPWGKTGSAPFDVDSYSHDIADALNASMASLAASHNWKIIDLYTPVADASRNSPYWAADGSNIHLTDAGKLLQANYINLKDLGWATYKRTQKDPDQVTGLASHYTVSSQAVTDSVTGKSASLTRTAAITMENDGAIVDVAASTLAIKPVKKGGYAVQIQGIRANKFLYSTFFDQAALNTWTVDAGLTAVLGNASLYPAANEVWLYGGTNNAAIWRTLTNSADAQTITAYFRKPGDHPVTIDDIQAVAVAGSTTPVASLLKSDIQPVREYSDTDTNQPRYYRLEAQYTGTSATWAVGFVVKAGRNVVMACPQHEVGPVASSFIPTTFGSVANGTDSLPIPTTGYTESAIIAVLATDWQHPPANLNNRSLFSVPATSGNANAIGAYIGSNKGFAATFRGADGTATYPGTSTAPSPRSGEYVAVALKWRPQGGGSPDSICKGLCSYSGAGREQTTDPMNAISPYWALSDTGSGTLYYKDIVQYSTCPSDAEILEVMDGLLNKSYETTADNELTNSNITLIRDFLQADVEYNKTAKTITWKHKDTGAVLLTKTDSTVDNVETVG